jgi:hypothetical protein
VEETITAFDDQALLFENLTTKMKEKRNSLRSNLLVTEGESIFLNSETCLKDEAILIKFK